VVKFLKMERLNCPGQTIPRAVGFRMMLETSQIQPGDAAPFILPGTGQWYRTI